jgi:hypothetical protein
MVNLYVDNFVWIVKTILIRVGIVFLFVRRWRVSLLSLLAPPSAPAHSLQTSIII